MARRVHARRSNDGGERAIEDDVAFLGRAASSDLAPRGWAAFFCPVKPAGPPVHAGLPAASRSTALMRCAATGPHKDRIIPRPLPHSGVFL